MRQEGPKKRRGTQRPFYEIVEEGALAWAIQSHSDVTSQDFIEGKTTVQDTSLLHDSPQSDCRLAVPEA